ncbi:PIN domain-containing protein [Streptomyces sp. NPDC091879]|uniref:PIN domain-containing protein n=1 Tax=Streptomyces sp. NPDC091879 TaxID=3366006 RepID=UPI0037F72360
MIIFDTNAVNRLAPDGPVADIVRKLRASGIPVAVPWMVLEELAAHQARLYPVKHKSAVDVLAKLAEAVPWVLESSLEPIDTEWLLDHWRHAYEDVFEVIPTSGEAARRALSRESMGLPPAKARQPGKDDEPPVGARDVAIWFSVMEFLSDHQDEVVHFVTNNLKDFGDGQIYKYPMDEDVRGLEGRLKRLTSFDEVVTEFTETVSGREAKGAAEELLRSPAVRSRVAQTAIEEMSSPVPFAGLGADETPQAWSEWASAPETDLLSIADVTGHRIGDDVWFTANARWLLYGLASVGGEETQFIACTWEMKLLFSSGENESPTVLKKADPSVPDLTDTTSAEMLERLKRRMEAASRQVVRNMLRDGSPAQESATRRVTPSLPQLGAASHLRSSLLGEQIAASIWANAARGNILMDYGLFRGSTLAAAMTPQTGVAAQLAASMPKFDFGINALLKNSDLTHPWGKGLLAKGFPLISGPGASSAASASGPRRDEAVEEDAERRPSDPDHSSSLEQEDAAESPESDDQQ